MSSLQLIPVNPCSDGSDIKGANVQAHYWHDEYYFQTFTGVALDVRESCFGPVALFAPDANQRNLPYTLPPRWLPLSYIVGAIFYGEATDIDPQTQTALTVS
jgi:hypothetical protein